MRIIFEILLAFVGFAIGYLASNSAGKAMLDEAARCLEESIVHEQNARKCLKEAGDLLKSQEARNKAFFREVDKMLKGGRHAEPSKTAGTSPIRDPERGGNRAAECGTLCRSDAAGGGEADHKERSEARG